MFLAGKPAVSADVQPAVDFVFVEKSPNYVTEDGQVLLPQDVGVNQPEPKSAGITFLVRSSGGSAPTIHYIDERGWANPVYRDGDGNYYFTLRDDVSHEHIYMKPNGRFPYIEIGKRENAALAEDVLAHSKSVTQAQLEQCLEQVKSGRDPDFITLTTSFAADEEQVRDAPRRGLVLSAMATARKICNVVPTKVSCYFRMNGGEPEFSNGYLFNY
jgi:hypothetical protein